MIAIVIPYYKIEYFEECLQSLANQSNKDFNVYIGNDNSPENPLPIIRKYENLLNITYHKFDNNIGGESLTLHWNRCLELVNGEVWAMLLCDDDMLTKNVIDDFYSNIQAIQAANISVIKYSTREINENTEFISKPYTHPVIQSYEEVFVNRFFGGSRSSLSEHIFLLSQYKKKGFRDLELAWHADDLAWLEFSDFGEIYTINSSLIYFRVSPHNISRPNHLQDKKRELSYNFYTIIINEYINCFNKTVAKKILKKYELMTYELDRSTMRFWFNHISYIFKYFNFLEIIKFSRRVFINRK